MWRFGANASSSGSTVSELAPPSDGSLKGMGLPDASNLSTTNWFVRTYTSPLTSSTATDAIRFPKGPAVDSAPSKELAKVWVTTWRAEASGAPKTRIAMAATSIARVTRGEVRAWIPMTTGPPFALGYVACCCCSSRSHSSASRRSSYRSRSARPSGPSPCATTCIGFRC